MKIISLMENTTANPVFQTEHGLSLYIETGGHTILFDTGQTAAFAHNAAIQHVDLSAVEFAVLSHAHYDHSGGLQAFLAQNHHAPVYLSRYAFETYTDSTGKYIGVDKALENHPQLYFVSADMQLADGIQLFTGHGLNRKQPINSYGLNVTIDGREQPDTFQHEQYLLITEGNQRVLLSGCSHRGIINIMSWFQPDILIGGFHFMKLDPQGSGKAVLDSAARELMQYQTQYYTCHCTGVPQYHYLKEQMNGQLQYLSCGQEIVL